ncbi:MAG: hypothetical protein GWN79_17455, partial [Actinobacteria bacterium]|nr:hypothetical protein [Actinomycetota bacterium]NIS33769.1 hypothetical protein [Actinomycetota bacterium]NIU20749.1 hypothetical protein [Actinomycetota bacterium]NIU68603.1 hypothetical protein [Actinomycetota bacterium]NIW30439.1 hypothetical protein [Actinomycetota bacterium]
SPADLPKAGAAYDLPIALAVLTALGYVDEEVAHSVCLGELALDGGVRPVRDALAAAMIAGRRSLPCVVPLGSGSDDWRDLADVRPVASLG